MDKKIILTALLFIFSFQGFSQEAPFNISLEPITIDDLGGLQSFAVGQHNGQWLIIGGRLDGLHRRQPWAAFDEAGHNNQLIVVDPVSMERWTAPLSGLPTSIIEQLSSTNMEFYQEGDHLYCIGGYGFSATANDHITFPNLTAIHVPSVIDAIINGNSYSLSFRQITDPKFQVTGGRLKKMNDNFYLLGGQKFIGRYNPMGPDHGPGFIQEYTDAIRIFSLTDDGTTISIEHLPSYSDSENLHRRDYNAVEQIMPDGQEGITMFSGVFQPDIDLPYLNAVNVTTDNYSVNSDFQQYYNHYHCAVVPLYSVSNNEMHSLFFGGIAQYYDDAGTLVQDNNVPFVNTIARVTRDVNGTMTEHKLPMEMPILLGAGAEFISNPALPIFDNGVVDMDQISSDGMLLGYIFGGISSSEANIFWINDGTQSSASSQIFKVFLTSNNPVSVHDLNEQSQGSLQMAVYPNPNDGTFVVQYNLKTLSKVKLTLTTAKGKILENSFLENQRIGVNIYERKIRKLDKGGVYLLTIETDTETATQKIIIEP